jgi:hypothetical protein
MGWSDGVVTGTADFKYLGCGCILIINHCRHSCFGSVSGCPWQLRTFPCKAKRLSTL